MAPRQGQYAREREAGRREERPLFGARPLATAAQRQHVRMSSITGH
jgi:hypothetical protein